MPLESGTRLGPYEIVEQTGFPLAIEGDVPETRLPTDAELAIIRERIDPKGFVNREVPA